MANRIYASPGTYTSEKDLTFTTETIGVTTLGVVGETIKGPAFQPIFVKNYDEFRTLFGGTSPEKFKNTQIIKYELPYIAKSYLSQSNQLFVTRILGLSGYEGGNAYALRTLGSCNVETLLEEDLVESTIEFQYNISTGEFTVGGNPLIDEIASQTGVDVDKFSLEFNLFFNSTNYTTADWYVNNVLYWGLLLDGYQTTITDDRNNLVTGATEDPEFIDAYVYGDIPEADKANKILNDEYVFVENTDLYNGTTFALFTYDIVLGVGTVTGKIKLYTYSLICEPYSDYHKKLIATFRSRGQYVSDELSFSVVSAGLSNTDSVLINPYASFNITGTTSTDSFTYTVSLDKNNRNFIKNVLGTTPFNKDTNLFVEEIYSSILNKGWTYGKIKGIDSRLISLNNWNHYKFQYQSPTTPFFVSELRGGLPQRLFRFISISDGANANTEIKISIANVDLSSKTFDVLVRSYSDSDKTPVILERYLSLTMDETQDSFIGRRIGTIDGKYPLKSAYAIVDIAENVPADGVPAGFEGYEIRTNLEDQTELNFIGAPEVSYKTKYYSAGETIVDPPFSSPIISLGDKIKKVYLGFTDIEYGYDADLLAFKGKISIDGDNTYNTGLDWPNKTKGFHFDINSSTLVDSFGNRVFASGVGTFVDPVVIQQDINHPYHDIRTRKFTALFSGGFDGWDIYRESRTNTNMYKIGRTGFTNGNFDTFTDVATTELFGTSDYYAYYMGANTFSNPEETIINILTTPGIDILNNSDLVEDVIEIIEEKRKDSIYLPTLPDIKLLNNNSATNSDDWLYSEDIVDALENTGIDSNYTAVYYPWIQINDTENNAYVFIPPTSEVVRNLAFTDNVSQPWFATAGYDRGIVNCIRARISVDQEARDTLYENGRINPIATFSDVGTVIWGNRNLQVKKSTLDRLNIRRLLLQARKLIVAVSNRLLFNPNDAQIRNEFLSLVNPILDNIRKERGLNDFRVALSPQIEDDDRNTLRGKIYLKPTTTLEFIELEFTVTEDNVSFDNI